MKIIDNVLIKQINDITFKQQQYTKGECIHHQGNPFEFLYFVSIGKLHFSYLTLDGRHFLFGNLECNDHLFGEVEYLSNIPSQWNIIASENIEVSIIKTSDLTNLLERTPSLYRFFAQGIASDLCEQNTIFLTNLMHSLKFKILNDIQARQHSNIQTLPYDNATQEAERFGTSYRVYRRVIKELIDDGFLKYEDKELTICNIMMVNSYLTNEK